MPSRQLGPWKLAVKDRVHLAYQRFLGFDGERHAWVWQLHDRDPESLASQLHQCDLWRPLAPPWVRTWSVVDGADSAMLSDAVLGVPLTQLASASGAGLSLEAAAAVAYEVARGFDQLPESHRRDDVPDFEPASVLVGFDGAVTLLPAPRVHPGSPHYVPGIGDDYEQQQREMPLKPGWRTFAPSLVLLHALGGSPPWVPGRWREGVLLLGGELRDEELIERVPHPLRNVIARALGAPEKRPSQAELLAALRATASRAALEEFVRAQFPDELNEQQYERTQARGLDPEPLPAELVASVSQGATDEAFGVLADWLLSEGRPRGELAALQLKLEQGASFELSRAEATVLSRHRSLLPVALRERLQQWRPLWKAGWLVGLEMKTVPDAETLTEILSHPTLRFLRRIRVRTDGGGSKVLAEVLPTVELPALRQLELDGGAATFAPKLKAANPRLVVENSRHHRDFPARRRPETSVAHAKVGVGNREPAPGLPPLKRLMDWLSGDD